MISYQALNRLVTEDAEKDPAKARTIALSERPLLRDGEAMSDEQLIAMASTAGVALDRAGLERLVRRSASAEELCRKFAVDAETTDGDRFATDRVWIAIVTLWRRWFPDEPSADQLDELMQGGYDALAGGDLSRAITCWTGAWQLVPTLHAKLQMRSLANLDERLHCFQFISNWVQDFEMELRNAGMSDPTYHEQRPQIAEEFLRLFPEEAATGVQLRLALGEAMFDLRRTEEADAYFQEWTEREPRRGWACIRCSDGWADSRHLEATETAERARAILQTAFAVPLIENRDVILERLDPGGNERGDTDRPVGTSQVGRNERCPCGSGVKFKKCCGKPS